MGYALQEPNWKPDQDTSGQGLQQLGTVAISVSVISFVAIITANQASDYCI